MCTFYIDRLLFGVDVAEVQEVLRAQDMTEVPLAPDVVSGLMNLRGQIVIALDMRTLLDLPPRKDNQRPMSVLIRMDDATISILVDEIGDVIDVCVDQFEPVLESVPRNILKMIHGVYKLDNDLLLHLDTVNLHSKQPCQAVSQLDEPH